MKLTFKQGIVRSFLSGNIPNFLEYDSTRNSITIDITTDEVLVTASYKNLNYLHEQKVTKINAWGPFSWNKSKFGPEPSQYTYYLYWDFNLSTGEVTTSYTPWQFIVSSSQPINPILGQNWYDTSKDLMQEWDGNFWRPVCRVFAGTFSPRDYVITHYPLGTQVGKEYPSTLQIQPSAGFIVFGMDQKGVKTSDGNFLTTETDVITNHGNYTSPVKLEALSTVAIAAEPLPEFYCITNSGLNEISLASSNDINKRAIGIVENPVVAGESVKYTTEGIIYNDQWNWDFVNGKDLFCGPTGELVQGQPLSSNSVGQKVATILSKNSILVQIDLFGNSSIVDIGPIGPTGPQGEIGLSVTGPTGPQGIQGEIGPIGETGLQGIQGITGPQGVSGLNGKTIYNNLEGPGVEEANAYMTSGSGGPIVQINPAFGSDGDYYLYIGDFYSPWYYGGEVAQHLSILVGPKHNGIWDINVSNVLNGPEGIQGNVGPTGPEGIQGNVGPTGPEGIQGSVGPTGPEGISINYVHTQPYADTTWYINHNKNIENFVITVFDESRKVVIPQEIFVVDNNNVTITFNTYVSGRATLVFAIPTAGYDNWTGMGYS